MSTPATPVTLMYHIYRKVIPRVHDQIKHLWHDASNIPNEELKKQALASIETKTFHCVGGSIYSLLAQDDYKRCIDFIVAYQTISDYLDNLCDRSTSLDPNDFRALHDSMFDALTPGKVHEEYYRYRLEKEDGGYLDSLVSTCQSFLKQHPHYEEMKDALYELARVYCDLQVHKHVKKEERIPRLKSWFEHYQADLPPMTWYEFSACSGSTLGIFCLISQGMQPNFTKESVQQIKKAYFPWVQGLHILLDYFIDQEEDRLGGDLNFCFYYDDDAHLIKRFHEFVKEAHQSIAQLPHASFHHLIISGLLGIYLADQKVSEQPKVKKIARQLLGYGGRTSKFFYLNGIAYRKIKQPFKK